MWAPKENERKKEVEKQTMGKAAIGWDFKTISSCMLYSIPFLKKSHQYKSNNRSSTERVVYRINSTFSYPIC